MPSPSIKSPTDLQTDDFLRLFLDDVPLMDVRAPVEFNQGAFPGARNLPLINDEEREQIGIRYKDMGQDKAVELGYELVKDDIKQQRVNAWSEFVKNHPDGVLYCFRGGMRSKITQQWIYQYTGVMYPRVTGGYKAMRRFLLDQLDESVVDIQPVILGGRTGTGKTLLLNRLEQCIDLEGLYNHRGSVFGKHVTPQPAQIDIENELSIQLLKHRRQQHRHLLMEDEAAAIGSRRIPVVLFDKMKQSPLVMLDASLEQRVDIIYDEYISAALDEHHQHHDAQQAFDIWAEQLLGSLDKVQKRLGGVRHKQLRRIMEDAIEQHRKHNDPQQHRNWIRSLLDDYYDPMYDYQIGGKQERVVFRGDAEQVLEYLRSTYSME